LASPLVLLACGKQRSEWWLFRFGRMWTLAGYQHVLVGIHYGSIPTGMLYRAGRSGWLGPRIRLGENHGAWANRGVLAYPKLGTCGPADGRKKWRRGSFKQMGTYGHQHSNGRPSHGWGSCRL